VTFQVFEREELRPAVTEPLVVVNAQGALVLSAAARDLLVGLRPGVKMVELLYDRDSRRVAVRPVAETSEGPTRFRVLTARSTGWPVMISAKEFSDFWKLPVGRQQSFLAAVEDVGGERLLVFDLRPVS
jgi:hypothetical protein